MLKSNKLFLLGISIVSLIAIFFMAYLTQTNCFWGDDAFYTQYEPGESVFSSLKFDNIHGCGYIGLFLCKFFSLKLPLILEIHPNDFLSVQCGFLRGFLNVAIILMISAFSIIHKKSKLLYFTVFTFTLIYFFDAGSYSNIIKINYNWWRYFFSLLFVSIFLFYLSKDSVSKKEIVIASISAYIIGTSIEINIMCFLYFLILLVLFRLKRGIEIYIPSFFLFFATFMFTSSPGFKDVASSRGASNIIQNLHYIKEYCITFFDIYFKNEWLYWLIFLILTVFCFIFAIKKNEVKKILFILLFELSILLSIFTLILCGKTCPIEDTYDFFLKHMNIIFLYKMIILYPLYSLISYIYNNTNEKFKYLVCIVIIILSVGIIHRQCNNQNFSSSYIEFIEYKKAEYKLQKIAQFYYLRDETPEIPPIYENDVNNSMWLNKMASIYKNPKILDLKYTISDDALEKYYEKGGTFSEKELEELKFSKIYEMK